MIFLSLFVPLATATPVACYGPEIVFLLPADGAEEVSPDAVPVFAVSAQCGGAVVATLTPGEGPETGQTAEGRANTLIWLTDLVLPVQDDVLLTFEQDEAYGPPETTTSFTTGRGPVATPSGVPTVSIVGSTWAPDNRGRAVELVVTPAEEPSGSSPYGLFRNDIGVAVGVDAQTHYDVVYAEDGEEICYAVVQYLADGEMFATSEKDCFAFAYERGEEEEDKPFWACGVAGGSATWMGVAMGLVALGRRGAARKVARGEG